MTQNIRLYERYNNVISPSYRDSLKSFATKNYPGIDTEWTEENIEFLVLVDMVKTVGLLVIIPYSGNKIHIMLIAIDENYRRRGLGTRLLTYVAAKYHKQKITLNVTLDKLYLINFYCKKKYAVAEEICLEQNTVTLSLVHVTLLAKIPLPEDD